MRSPPPVDIVLVHGAVHGAWWARVVPWLETGPFDAGHSPFVTHPEALAGLLLDRL